MTVKQLAEGVTVAGDVGGQQLGVTAFPLDASPETHGRDSNQSVVARHFTQMDWVRAPVRTQPEP